MVRRKHRKAPGFFSFFNILVVLVPILVIGLFGFYVYAANVSDTVSFEVVNTETKNYDGESTYLIFTKKQNGQNEVFENVDSIFKLKFNSSDVQMVMQPGYKCNAQVTGFRIPFLSMYRNIITVNCTNPQEIKE